MIAILLSLEVVKLPESATKILAAFSSLGSRAQFCKGWLGLAVSTGIMNA